MFEAVSYLDPRNPSEFAPAALTILTMPLAFSISAGMGIGIITLAVIALATGQRRHLNPVILVLACFFLLHFLEKPLLERLR
jgi:AGZA family xanthine/uracil permease-like MFS transporter